MAQPAERVLVVGDASGVRQLIAVLPPGCLVGFVAASNRPQYHAEMAQIAREAGVPLLVQPPWRSPEYAGFAAAAAALEPDLLVCNSYSLLLRDDVLALVQGRAFNVHGGALPEFRGANPIQWAIIEDVRETAATMHEMTSELDAGCIVAERRVAIGFRDGWRAVSTRLSAETELLLAETIPAVLAGTATARPQDADAATSRPRRTPDDGRIDWNQPVVAIYNLVRALGDGIPPAFYERDGTRVAVESPLTPGEVAALAFAPGPGQRRFAHGVVELIPAGGELADFRVLRGGRETGTASLLPIDLERRVAAVRTEPGDAEAAALSAEFARDELGFSLEP